MKCRQFDIKDQLCFARLSGDYNPIHIDSVVARRSVFGDVVVHGIHGMLWALDVWLEHHDGAVVIDWIKAVFHRPIGIGKQVSWQEDANFENHSSADNNANAGTNSNIKSINLLLYCEGSIAMKISLKYHTLSDVTSYAQTITIGSDNPPRHACIELSPEQAEDISGHFDLAYCPKTAKSLFNTLATVLPANQISQILASTRLVGMLCPGLHSTFSALEMNFSDLDSDLDNRDGQFHYQMAKLNARFGLASMAVNSQDMTGTLTALFRPAPMAQIDYQGAAAQVTAGEFAGQRALVVGGSRGLGEVCAKLLCAGGADVKISYYKGKEDAEQIVTQIIDQSGKAFGRGGIACISFNTIDEQQAIKAQLPDGWMPTHLYYFSTPFIGQGAKNQFNSALFEQFCQHYIVGFERLVSQLDEQQLQGIFYPSSVFVEQQPNHMGEYAAAKMAGESVCNFIRKTRPTMNIVTARLPKMATDQTASFMTEDTPEPASVLLPYLRQLSVN